MTSKRIRRPGITWQVLSALAGAHEFADARDGVRLRQQPRVALVRGRPGSLAEAADWQPDVILMDVVMPVMDGPKVFAGLRNDARTEAIPVIFMTARSQGSEVAHFMELGAAGVIVKPFDPLTLAQSVRDCLGHRRNAC